MKVFYKTHSLITLPKGYSFLFNNLPNDIVTLCQIIRDLFIHIADEDIFNYAIPPERYKEMHYRYTHILLKKIFEKDNRSLVEKRSVSNRLIGICRDMALLVCSILRHRGIPARLRVGFADYFTPGIYLDGMWLEYWDSNKEKWCMADVRTASVHIEKYKLNIDFDLYDIPAEKFISAELAWKLCRECKIKPSRIGSRRVRGLWYVRDRLIQSLATLNKKEVLIWDMWGYMLNQDSKKQTMPTHQLFALDKLSEFLLENAYLVNQLQDYYQSHPAFQIPEKLTIFNLYDGLVEEMVSM